MCRLTTLIKGRVVAISHEPGGAVSHVYVYLRGRIVDGAIPPRTKINIEHVARQLELSQTPVREALQKLEADGLLDYQPGRGYTTTPVLDAAGLDVAGRRPSWGSWGWPNSRRPVGGSRGWKLVA
jgi:DNA-binding transcriptional MocR family regulator